MTSVLHFGRNCVPAAKIVLMLSHKIKMLYTLHQGFQFVDGEGLDKDNRQTLHGKWADFTWEVGQHGVLK